MKSRMRESCTYGSVRGDSSYSNLTYENEREVNEMKENGNRLLNTKKRYETQFSIYKVDYNRSEKYFEELVLMSI